MAGHAKPMELHTQRININNKNPNKDLDSVKPPFTFASGLWQPSSAASHTRVHAASSRGWGLADTYSEWRLVSSELKIQG